MEAHKNRGDPITAELRYFIKHKESKGPGFRVRIPVNSLKEADEIVARKKMLDSDMIQHTSFKVYSGRSTVLWDYSTQSRMPNVTRKKLSGHKPTFPKH